MNEKLRNATIMALQYQLSNASPVFPFALFSYYWSVNMLDQNLPHPAVGIAQRSLVAIKDYSHSNADGVLVPRFTTDNEYFTVLRLLERDFAPIFVRHYLVGHEIGHHCWPKEGALSSVKAVVKNFIDLLIFASDDQTPDEVLRGDAFPPDVRLAFNRQRREFEEALLSDFPPHAGRELMEAATSELAEELFADVVSLLFLTKHLRESQINAETIWTYIGESQLIFDCLSTISSISSQLNNRPGNFTLRFSASRSAFRHRHLPPLMREVCRECATLPVFAKKFWLEAAARAFLGEAPEFHLIRANVPAGLARGGFTLGFFRNLPSEVAQTASELHRRYGDEAGAHGILQRPFRDDLLPYYDIATMTGDKIATDSVLKGFAAACKTAGECLFHRDMLVIHGTDLHELASRGADLHATVGIPLDCIESGQMVF